MTRRGLAVALTAPLWCVQVLVLEIRPAVPAKQAAVAGAARPGGQPGVGQHGRAGQNAVRDGRRRETRRAVPARGHRHDVGARPHQGHAAGVERPPDDGGGAAARRRRGRRGHDPADGRPQPRPDGQLGPAPGLAAQVRALDRRPGHVGHPHAHARGTGGVCLCRHQPRQRRHGVCDRRRRTGPEGGQNDVRLLCVARLVVGSGGDGHGPVGVWRRAPRQLHLRVWRAEFRRQEPRPASGHVGHRRAVLTRRKQMGRPPQQPQHACRPAVLRGGTAGLRVRGGANHHANDDNVVNAHVVCVKHCDVVFQYHTHANPVQHGNVE